MNINPPKILAVITTFNPGDIGWVTSKQGSSFNHFWFKTIYSWLEQKEVELDLIVADTISGSISRERLKAYQELRNKFNLIFINEHYSMLVAINLAIMLSKKEKYNYFAFSHSDLEFQNKYNLQKLLGIFGNYPNTVLVAPQSDRDMFLYSPQLICFNEDRVPSRIVIGEGVNGHLFIWNKRFAQAYDYKIPDILEGSRVEDFFHYLCAAIKGNWMISHDVQINHLVNQDKGGDYRNQESKFYHKDFYQMLREGVPLGLGHQECLPYSKEPNRIDKDRKLYNKSGYPIYDKALHFYLKENLFLKKDRFDYDKINYPMKMK